MPKPPHLRHRLQPSSSQPPRQPSSQPPSQPPRLRPSSNQQLHPLPRLLLCLLLSSYLLLLSAGCKSQPASSKPDHSKPPSASQAETGSYSDHDVAQMTAFLNHSENGVSNAEILG